MTTKKVPARYADILRDWPPRPERDAQGQAGLGGVGSTLAAKAEAVKRGDHRPRRDTLPRCGDLPGGDAHQGGGVAGTELAVAALVVLALPFLLLLLPVVFVLLAGALAGGPVKFLRYSRARAYNFARWGGNVQPWLEARPDKIAKRYARRKIGKVAGRTFSWQRFAGL